MLFFELLQEEFAKRMNDRLEFIKSRETEKNGIDRLPPEQRPPQVFLLQWIGEGRLIEQHNHVMDEQCSELLKMLEDYGLKGTVLKGQGIAKLYDIRCWKEEGRGSHMCELRQPGDIDVYVDCGLENALEFAKSIGQKDIEWDYKHLHLKIWDGTEIEIHYRVEVLLNLWKNRKLQKWFHKHQDAVQGSRFKVQGGEVVTPTIEFNVFYILLHIYRHFLYEGVGMRQIVDYYFVLKAKANTDGTDKTDYARETVAQFGMEKFAKGLMWVMQEALGMPREWMLWEPDQKEGEYILDQVMKGGNFGHYDERLKHSRGKLGAVKKILMHNIHLLTHYPADTIWAPVWIVWHKLWKIKTKMCLAK